MPIGCEIMAMPININELKERGLGIETVEQFAHSLVSMDVVEDNSRINDWGAVTDTGVDLLLPVKISDTHFRFMPGPEFSPRLYRGETEFHPMCVPTMFRPGISSVDRCFAIGKGIELSTLMDHHPATNDLKESRIGDLSFELNIEAIAQHYGFKTGLMDFSRSRDVAMFFATCRHDPATETYAPLQEGTAVLYTADLKQLIHHRKGSAAFLPLGLEPLPRPEAQRALAVRLNPGENLNDMPWVARQAVEITPELSQHYFDMFDGGAKLFPVNPFEDHVRSIRKSKFLPLEVLAFGMYIGQIPGHPQGVDGARSELLAAGYEVERFSIAVHPAVIQAAGEEWERQKDGYYERIRCRGVCDLLVLD